MKRLMPILIIAAACGGPTQEQLAETPTATTRPRAVEAAPASTNDKERERVVQSFDDMGSTQRAYREARKKPAPEPTAIPVIPEEVPTPDAVNAPFTAEAPPTPE